MSRRKPSPSSPTPTPARATASPPAMPVAGVSRGIMGWIVGFLVFSILLAWVGLMNRGQLNTDGIAYVQIARHYAAGRFDLAVSGYWGPLFSWLMVPWLKMGFVTLDAGRAVMAVSGMVFAAGSGRFLQAVLEDRSAVRIGTALAGVAALFWSAQYLTPDLLVSGLLLLALGELFRKEWLKKSSGAARAGVFLGLAYLAKAVAFPVAGLLILLSLVLWAGTKQGGWKSAWMAAIKTGVVFALVAVPWMGVLTAKYGAPTFSTSGKINHAIVGPSDVERWHSFGRTFQTPEPGRLTVWEEPSPKDYKYWSPFQSATYFQHQVGLVKKNLETVAGLLFQVDWIGLGLLSMLVCVVILPPWRERLGTERWRWGVFALAITAGIYLPVYVRVADDRYFYIAFPLFWSTATGAVLWMTAKSVAKNPWPRRIGVGIVTVSFGFFPAFRAVSAAGGLNNPPVVAAHMLSESLTKAGLAGPVVGSASIFGERAGLYTAFLLDQPWVGDKAGATSQEWRDSGARLVILKRDDPQAAIFSTAPGFRDLDGVLSTDPSWNSSFPLKVFEILR